MINRSYYIWGILVFLVLLSQMLGIVEKIWIKYWGEAYGAEKSSAFVFNSFTHHDQAVIGVSHVQGRLHHYGMETQTLPARPFNLPDAHEHPLFYVGIYASIGLCTTLISVSSAAAQYTGALKASRTLFKWVISLSALRPGSGMLIGQLLTLYTGNYSRPLSVLPSGSMTRHPRDVCSIVSERSGHTFSS